MNGDLLTPDEQLAHGERWQGETRDFPTAIRAWAKLHGLASEVEIDDGENWQEAIEELGVMVMQLRSAK